MFGPYAWAYWTMMFCNLMAPQVFWSKYHCGGFWSFSNVFPEEVLVLAAWHVRHQLQFLVFMSYFVAWHFSSFLMDTKAREEIEQDSTKCYYIIGVKWRKYAMGIHTSMHIQRVWKLVQKVCLVKCAGQIWGCTCYASMQRMELNFSTVCILFFCQSSNLIFHSL